MLTELRVRDLGVIADLTLEFEPGMTVLTGETGAGKTLLVQALQLVLGGRASPGVVRAGAGEALVEARFSLGNATDQEIVLARSVAATGRSRAWVDGRMAPVGALAEAGASMVDIHGQHEQQSLVSGPAQRALLDAFARSDLAPLAQARALLADIDRQLHQLGGDERERARLADLLGYQVSEIDSARIADVDEDMRLRDEEDRLADIAAVREAAGRALGVLDGDAVGDRDARDAVTQLGAALSSLSAHRALEEPAGRVRRLLDEISDLVSGLRVVTETWEEDPERLADVQGRRRLFADLRRKYGESLADVVTFGQGAAKELEEIEGQAERAVELEARRAEAWADVAQAEHKLRSHRAAAAPALSAAATTRLRDLAMPGARFEIVVGDEGAGDDVTFLLGANEGEPVAPLARVASGGELARTMLALRLVAGGGAPTMLFDEVDAGVGGSAALALARSLAEVAERRQVLVVTHLAQVAAFADHQVEVRKEVTDGGRTVTGARSLGGAQRVVELSRMLSGHPDSPTARAHAEELLVAARATPTSTSSGSGDD